MPSPTISTGTATHALPHGELCLLGACSCVTGAMTRIDLGGSSLLMVLIQRGAATRVTSLLYLVPPCTALLAWWLFGERMASTGWLGMALCAVGVGLVLRNPSR